jgi:hypothetical protein
MAAFTPVTDAEYDAMSMDELQDFRAACEELFTQVRRLYQRRPPPRGQCPKIWKDIVAEISKVQQVIITRTLAEFAAAKAEDPCADPN